MLLNVNDYSLRAKPMEGEGSKKDGTNEKMDKEK